MIPLGVNGKISNIKLSSYLDEQLYSKRYDTLLVGCPHGFSPLGILRMELESIPNLLNLLDQKIKEFNDGMELLISGFKLGKLNIILAPNQNSKFYHQNWNQSQFGNWRDFIYTTLYYSFVAASKMNTVRLGFTHTFHGLDQDYVHTFGDALGKYADSYKNNSIEEVIFSGCCFKEEWLENLFNLNEVGAVANHRKVEHEIFKDNGNVSIRIQLRN